MRPAEATSTDRTTTASRKPASSRVLDSATGQFASILSVTRRSSQRVMDALKGDPQRETAPAKTRAKDLASKAKDRSSRSEADSQSQVDSPKETNDADQPRSKDRAEQAVQADENQVHEDEAREQETASGQSVQAQHERPAERTPILLPGNAAVAVQADSVQPSGESVTGVVAQVAGGNEAFAFVPAPITAGGLNPAAKSWNVDPPAITAGGVNQVQNAAPSLANEGDAPANAVNASVVSGAKPAAEGAARTTGTGSASDFQDLLQQLGRSRVGQVSTTAPTDPKGKAASVADKAAVDMESTEALSDLARVVRSKVGSRDSSMTLAMSPPELGRLRIDVKMEQDGLNVHFQTETTGGEDALKGKLHELRAALEQQGVKVDRMDVEYVPPMRDAGSGQNTGSHAQSDGRHFQTPNDSGQWGRHTGQSFDAPNQARVDWEPEAETAAGWPMTSIPSWIGLSSGVDLVA